MDKSAAPSGIAALKDGGNWVLDPVGKANLLERTFASKCKLPCAEVNEFSALSLPFFTDGFLRIRCRDVLRVLKNLKEDSATGPDLLAACFLKACAEVLALPLALLARQILATHRWPQLWTYHWIAALHKKKSVFDLSNYRGIHLTSQASKVIERVLGTHLFPPLIERAFTESQFAYRPKRGARDAVRRYVATWLFMLNAGNKVGVYCSDVSGAFDRVSAERRLEKLVMHHVYSGPLVFPLSFMLMI